MKVLVIKGSPRAQGNSSLLMEEVLNGLKEKGKEGLEINTINPYQLDINPCINCDNCQQELKCIFDDDMNDLYMKFDRSDIILVATSIYFNGTPAKLKAMIDRCQLIWSSKYIFDNSIIKRDKQRIGYLLATGGAPEYDEQFCCIKKVMKMFFKVINTDFKNKLLISNVDKKPVKNRKKILNKAYQIGLDLTEAFN